ncbi:hypothetical protein [Pedobacter arcticus]|uniref:hypothetical protein n=1 Tax=Pedobacter arcticus TaxID=752140 RepID=UPI00031AD2BD|nr:hypothetical protein [Pedobacter arcticus]
MTKNTGLTRFTNQLNSLKNLLSLAKEAQNPALTFYSSNARQILFYLEALSRIYKEIHNEKLFKGFKNDFKSLEDQLGKIDYFDAYYKELAVLPSFPKKISEHLRVNYQQELQKLGNLLVANRWLDNKLVEINEELIKADWLSPDDDRKAVAKTIAKEIKSIEKDYKTGELNFKDLEHGVHEFRRQIRWISIYAQALDGLIQLKPDDLSQKLSVYLTKDIIESKFNVMPSSKNLTETINISQAAFYALSWMIAKSGDLKDEGLKLICVEECMKAINFLPELEIEAKAKRLLPDLKVTPKEIKAEMKVLADQFLTQHRVLDILRDDLKAVYKDQN